MLALSRGWLLDASRGGRQRVSDHALGGLSAPDTWLPIPGPARAGHSGILDPIRNRLVVFGGDNGQAGPGLDGNDVWALSLAGDHAWVELRTTGGPPAGREAHSAVYDPVRDRMIVFGGATLQSTDSESGNVYVPANDTWALSLADLAWTKLSPHGELPPPRVDHSAIFDPGRDRMIIFGGNSFGRTLLHDLWSLDLSGDGSWSELPGPEPFIGRTGHTAIFDSRRDRMVVFGGVDSLTDRNDVWAMSLANAEWSQVVPTSATRPPPLIEATAVYDAASDGMLVFGGQGLYRGGPFDPASDAIWTLSLETDTWSKIAPPLRPRGREGHAAVLDAAGRQMIVFGGYEDDYYYDGPRRGDAWSFALDSGTWSQVIPSGGTPEGRAGHTAVYDPLRHRAIVFGGYNAQGDTFLADTWQLSLDDFPVWSRLAVADPAPSGRAGHSAIYDPVGDRMIVFGGEQSCGESCSAAGNDLWSLSLAGAPTWTPLLPSGASPPALSGQSAIYDPIRRRMVVFGGTDFVSSSNAVWTLELSGEPVWSRLSTAGTSPAVRSGHSAIYDPVGDRMLIFGAGPSANDTWALNFDEPATWEELHPTGPPPAPRISHTAVYDPNGRRMLVYGGYPVPQVGSDLWALSLDVAPAWSELSPSDSPPPPRGDHIAVYDPVSERMLVHGGNRGYTYDTWMLELADVPTPVLISLVSAQARAGRIELDWFSTESPGPASTVYRRTADTVWCPLSVIRTDGRGHLRFTDPDVAPGERYAYRLGYDDGGGMERFTEAAWVRVPLQALALAGLMPNPAVGDLTAGFSLESESSARLELLDVTGKVWATRDVGGLGPGSHVVSLGRSGLVPAGMYWIRLTQGGHSRVARGAVMR